jgi:hypothetical protein
LKKKEKIINYSYKIRKRKECEVAQEITMRTKIAELDLNFERYRKKN